MSLFVRGGGLETTDEQYEHDMQNLTQFTSSSVLS